MKNLLRAFLIVIICGGAIEANETAYTVPYTYGPAQYYYPVTYYQPVVIQPAPVVIYKPVTVVATQTVPVYHYPVVSEQYVPCWRRYWNYSPQQYLYIRY